MLHCFSLTPVQIIFIVVASVVVLLILSLVLAIYFIKVHSKKNFKNYYYKKIYSIALNNDYYLINNFAFRVDTKNILVIDHLLFGNKFIYVIMDKCYEGDLMGNASDPDLVLIQKNGEKTYVENPFFSFGKLLSKFSTSTGISTTLLIGITLINNDSRMNIETSSKQFFMIQRKRLPKLIKKIESRDVGLINAEGLQEAVLTVNDLNRKDLIN